MQVQEKTESLNPDIQVVKIPVKTAPKDLTLFLNLLKVLGWSLAILTSISIAFGLVVLVMASIYLSNGSLDPCGMPESPPTENQD